MAKRCCEKCKIIIYWKGRSRIDCIGEKPVHVKTIMCEQQCPLTEFDFRRAITEEWKTSLDKLFADKTEKKNH